MVKYKDKHRDTLPVGGETAPAVVRVLKKCRFRQSETIDLFQNKWLNSPRFFIDFLINSCNLREICLAKLARGFLPFTWPRASAKSDQWSPKGFLPWSSSIAIARPWCFAFFAFWVHLAVDSGRETTWTGRFWQPPPHCIDSTCVY